MSSIQTYNSDNAEWGYVNNSTEGPFYIKVLAALPLAWGLRLMRYWEVPLVYRIIHS